MRIYLNAQFSSGRNRDHLLSVGMVSQYGEFYRVLDDQQAVEHARRNPWMKQHVLSRLPYDEEGRDWVWEPSLPDHRQVQSVLAVADDLLDFVDAHRDPEFWGWQSSFAYVMIRHLFGRLTERPDGFPLWCGELAAAWDESGRPELPPRAENGHHALEQARWARDVDELLTERRGL